MGSKRKNRYLVANIGIFIILPMVVALVIYIRMVDVLRSYMERQVAVQADVLNELAYRQFRVQLDEMERITEYFSDGKVKEEDMPSYEELLKNQYQVSMGIVRLDGSAVIGEPLLVSEYPAVQKAFRGYNAIRYRKDEGILFTVPIFNGNNIKYVLYECIDEDVLFETFNDNCYEGAGQDMLMDPDQGFLIPLPGNGQKAEAFFETEDIQGILNRLLGDMKSKTVSSSYYKTGNSKGFLFMADISHSDLYLVGAIPYDAVAKGISGFSRLVVLTFILLIALLTIGALRVMIARKKIEESEELRKAKQEVEEANRAKTTFLANMTHELRTPINTIMGMDEMIIRETENDLIRERAMDIKSASQILLGLINDVLDFSKIESEELNIIPVEYNLANFVRDLSILSENRARAKSLNFQVEVQRELPIGLFGDDIRFRQVLTNLLTNAVKYTPRGSVRLKITGKEEENDTIMLHCEVIDTGIGIKPEDIPKLYIPYVRIEEARNRHLEGSGLGLAIVINLLKMMGSKLHVDSVYGEGSNFYFDLEQKIVDREPVGDIRKRMEDMVKDYEYKVACVAPKARVLMVDDNAMNRKIFAGLLKPTRISVTTVSSGMKCLSLVKKEHFDIIFMDHLMPEMDGVETLRQLRAMDSPCKDTPVVALTANVFSGAKERYLSWGFDGFVEKPIATEKLEKILQAMLPQEYLEAAGAEDKEKGKTVAGMPEEMPDITGVNWDYAFLYIKDKDILMDMMDSFYKGIDEEYRTLTQLAEQIDTEKGLSDYQVRVHALKSSAAMVGVLTVSGLARIAERAAKEAGREMILTVNPLLLEELLWIKEQLCPFLEKVDHIEKKPADTPTLLALLEMLRISMAQMDIGGADAAMRQIQAYTYQPEVESVLDQINQKVAVLDFEGAEELVDRLMKENS